MTDFDLPGPTERLRFRQWRDDDAAWMIDMYGRPNVYRYLGAEPRAVHDHTEATTRIRDWNARSVGIAGVWALVERDQPDLAAPIGTAILVPLSASDGRATDAFEVGWHLHPSAQRKGYATEAANALIERARQAGLPMVRAVLFPENSPSAAVCLRLGMQEHGITEDWYGARLTEYRLDLSPHSPSIETAE